MNEVKEKEDVEEKKATWYKQIGTHEKHAENPFMEKVITDVTSVTVRKYRKIGTSNKDLQLIAVNPKTSEVQGYTQFVETKLIDEEKFMKMYVAEFGAFYNLGKPAMKVLHYIMTILTPKKDTFMMRIDKCMDFTGYTGKASVLTGLTDLMNNGIIARTMYNDEFYINPLIMFNGDRISFVKLYVKNKKGKENKEEANNAQPTLL